MEMKQYSVRIDRRLAEIVERNAEQQGAKLARYIRSLIEKGLVVDAQIQQGMLADKKDNSKNYFDIRTAELLAENVALSRKILRKQFKNAEISHDEIIDAERRSKEFISKLVDGNMQYVAKVAV
jgi:hypothetical protein